MSTYDSMTREQLKAEHDALTKEYDAFKAKGLALNMARGKPSDEQLKLSLPMMDMFTSKTDYHSESGENCLNYGNLTGIPEAKRLMGVLLDEDPENVIVGGNSSLALEFDALSRLLDYGSMGSKPWYKYDHISFIDLVPGYDRHFAMLEHFGIDMIPLPLFEDGPDMDEVERIVAADDTVKGLICVPKYSNPSGYTLSDETVRRMASMKTAADDFRIFWDNAYSMHHLSDDVAEQDKLLDIGLACREAGNPHRYIKFGSTSKITFAGSGISGLAASPEVLKSAAGVMQIEMIGYNKVNQLMHGRFLDSEEAVIEHMKKHAELLRPKFSLVIEKLEAQLAPLNLGSWTNPRGGYFIMFNTPEGCAKRTVQLAKDAGMVLTGAGSTWPHKVDPADSDIRIAPSLPPIEELDAAMDLFCCCVKLAAVEALLN